jgi:hypothetical protein
MEKRNYNGFASEAQYEAVKNAVKNAIVNYDVLATFMVTFEDKRINVYADGLSFDIDTTEETINNIECEYPMGMFEVDMVQEVYERMDDIMTALRTDEFEFIAEDYYPDDFKSMIENEEEDEEYIVDRLSYEISGLLTEMNNYIAEYGWNYSLESGIDYLMDYVAIVADNNFEDKEEFVYVIKEANEMYSGWFDYSKNN